MSQSTYTGPLDVLADTGTEETAPSTTRQAIDEHTRYIEEAYGLPEQRSRVLALAQFGADSDLIRRTLDISERAVRKHWTLLHERGANPTHYHDIFGARHIPFNALGTTDGRWPWPWQLTCTLTYDDPDTGAAVRLTVYSDTYFTTPGTTDHLAIRETTQMREGSDTTTRDRHVHPDGDILARYLTTTADTPTEYMAATILTELINGSADGQVSPEDVLNLSYDDLPAVDGDLTGPAAPGVDLFRDDVKQHLTTTTSHIDWEYVHQDTDGGPFSLRFPDLELTRTDDGLSLH